MSIEIGSATPSPGQPKPRRSRPAEPISKRVAKNGTTTYEFRIDAGCPPTAPATAAGTTSTLIARNAMTNCRLHLRETLAVVRVTRRQTSSAQ